MKKQILAYTLIMTILLSLVSAVSVIVSAADPVIVKIGNVGYTSIEDAVAAADDYDTVVLQTDIVITATISISTSKTLILDMNNKQILYNAGNNTGLLYMFYIAPSLSPPLNYKAPTIKIVNARLDARMNTNISNNSGQIFVIRAANANLTLENVQIGMGPIHSDSRLPISAIDLLAGSKLYVSGSIISCLYAAISKYDSESRAVLRQTSIKKDQNYRSTPRLFHDYSSNGTEFISLAPGSIAVADREYKNIFGSYSTETVQVTSFTGCDYKSLVVVASASGTATFGNSLPYFSFSTAASLPSGSILLHKDLEFGYIPTKDEQISTTKSFDYSGGSNNNTTIDLQGYTIIWPEGHSVSMFLVGSNNTLTIKNGTIKWNSSASTVPLFSITGSGVVNFENMCIETNANNIVQVNWGNNAANKPKLNIKGGRYSTNSLVFSTTNVPSGVSPACSLERGTFTAQNGSGCLYSPVVNLIYAAEGSMLLPEKWRSSKKVVAVECKYVEAANMDTATFYDRVSTATSKAGNGHTIKLTKSIEMSSTSAAITLTNNVNLDLNGHKITSKRNDGISRSAAIVLSSTKTTIRNGTIELDLPSGQTGTSATLYLFSGVNLTLDNVNITAKAASAEASAIITKANTELIFRGSGTGGKISAKSGVLKKEIPTSNINIFIYGGSFDSPDELFESSTIKINPASVEVSSKSPVSGVMTNFLTVTNYGDDNSYRIGNSVSGGEYFATLQEALNKAASGTSSNWNNSSPVIYMIRSHTTQATISADTNLSFTLDLCEQTLRGGQGVAPVIKVIKGSVNFQNGTIISPYDDGKPDTNFAVVIAEGANSHLTFDSGRYEGQRRIIGTRNGATSSITARQAVTTFNSKIASLVDDISNGYIDQDILKLTTSNDVFVRFFEGQSVHDLNFDFKNFDIDGVSYARDFATARYFAKDGSTIKLARDFVVESSSDFAVIADKRLTIDLNGKTVSTKTTGAGIPMVTVSVGVPNGMDGNQIIIKNGTINNYYNPSDVNTPGTSVAILNADVILDNVNVENARTPIVMSTKNKSDYTAFPEKYKPDTLYIRNCNLLGTIAPVLVRGEAYVTIESGIFDRKSGNPPRDILLYDDGTATSKELQKKYFKFAEPYWSSVADPYSANGRLEIQSLVRFSIGSTEYLRMSDALNAVQEGETINVNGSFKPEAIEFTPDCSFSINLNGYQAKNEEFKSGLFAFNSGAEEHTITIRNGSLNDVAIKTGENVKLVLNGLVIGTKDTPAVDSAAAVSIINSKLSSEGGAALKAVTDVYVSVSEFTGETVGLDLPAGRTIMTLYPTEVISPVYNWETAQYVRIGTAVAQNINSGISYLLLSEAVLYSSDGDEIKLNAAQNIITPIIINKSITIDFQNNIVYGSGSTTHPLEVAGGANVRFKNGKIYNNSVVMTPVGEDSPPYVERGAIKVTGGSTLTIESGNYEGIGYSIESNDSYVYLESGIFYGALVFTGVNIMLAEGSESDVAPSAARGMAIVTRQALQVPYNIEILNFNVVRSLSDITVMANLKNNLTGTLTADGMIAVYEDNRLVCMEAVPIALAGSKTEAFSKISGFVPTAGKSYEVKMFIWNSIESMTPVSEMANENI